MTARRVVVIEGEDAAPEAVRPTVRLLEGLGVDLEFVHPPIGQRALDAGESSFPPAARAAIDASDATLFGSTNDCFKILEREGLLEIIECSSLHCLDSRVDRAFPSEQNHFTLDLSLFEFLK